MGGMVKLHDCSRCSGPTVEHYESRICIQCGYSDYSVDPRIEEYRNRRRVREKRGSQVIGMEAVPKKGGTRGNLSTKVYTVSYLNGNGAETIRYDVACPYRECGEVCSPKDRGVKRRKEHRYSCTVGHVWYLLVKDHQPVCWMQEVLMPRVGKKHYPYTAKGKTAAKKAAKRTGKKMTNTRKKR